MKTHFLKRLGVMAACSTLSMTFASVSLAQTTPTNPTGSTENTKDDSNSTGSRTDNTAGSSASQPGTLDRTSSKDDKPLDQNPSQAKTGNPESAATKDPTGSPSITSENEKAPATSTHKDTTANKERNDNTPMTDQTFFAKASQDGMTEVELGKLAQQQGTAQGVKSFGSQMATDHAKANDQLKTLAQQKGVAVPDKLDASHQAAVDRLKHLSGPAFDKAFAKTMVHDHQKAVRCFQSESTAGQDKDVKDFAAKTLPTLQHHLTEAQNLQAQVK